MNDLMLVSRADLVEGVTEAVQPVKAKLEKLEAELSRYHEALTPSADTKADYHGDFTFDLFQRTEEGEDHHIEVTVPWTTIKLIMARIVQRASSLQRSGDGK